MKDTFGNRLTTFVLTFLTLVNTERLAEPARLCRLPRIVNRRRAAAGVADPVTNRANPSPGIITQGAGMQTISGPFRPFRLLAALALALAAATFGMGTASAQPSKRGGTLILGVEGEPSSLTAHLATDTAAMMVAYNVFNGLIGLDEKLEPTPDLAEKWSVSPDGKVYTFELAKNAKWHDGKPVTAEDAEYSFNEIIAKVHPRAGSWWPNVASAKATGPYTFVITLKAPYAPFLTLVASVLSSGTLILPKHIYLGTDPKTNPANQKPIGSGPFKFAKWERGSFVELTRNDDYFKAGKPYLDRLVFKIMPDAAARLLAFERGEVDFLHWYIVPYDQVAKLRKDARFQLVEKGDAAATNGLRRPQSIGWIANIEPADSGRPVFVLDATSGRS